MTRGSFNGVSADEADGRWIRDSPLCTVSSRIWHVRYWQILLKKSFWGDTQNFPGPLTRFTRGDMRDHIVSHKSDYGASYERYGVLQ
jgi:hypothetical protein